ncbi:hypothetical protein OG436_29395 [Streptomyces caniferus]|uniref:aggregation-promoting factor C-terminal-like domain-containing protein n=1 Tax=Streptomyces caniferus TaxID=285557 RepID=UPI002E2CB976|nr:hypothetical protein [Streptomyces caniferus]
MPNLDIVGSAAVDVVPIIPNFHTKLKALVLPIADKVGEEAGRRMGDAISDNIVIAIPSAINQGGRAAVAAATRQGDNSGGAFSRALRAKLDAAFKAMPRLDIKATDTGVDAELARVRAKLDELRNKRVGIDISVAEAVAKADALSAKLARLGAESPNIRVKVDTATARAALNEFRVAALTAGTTAGNETGGAFSRALKARIEAARNTLPDLNIGFDASRVDADIARIREELASLTTQHIGIDLSTEAASAKVDELMLKLRRIGAESASVQVRADTGKAVAELEAFQAEILAVDAVDPDVTVRVNTGQASSALLFLAIQMGITAAIPLGPVIAAGLGAVVSAATAAGAALGGLAIAAVPSILAVKNALAAQKASQDEAKKSTDDGGKAAKQAAQQALQMASAQQALTAAHRNAAQSIAQANRQVSDAERAVGDAAARAAEQRKQAADGVKRAEQGVADAHRGVRQAEQSLTDAQRSARQAQDDLTAARKTAAEQLKALDDQLADGALSQRDATLRVQEAQQELQRTMAAANLGKASQLDIARAQLGYDQALQHAKEQQQSYKDLQKSADKQKKAGVDGNEAVKSAVDRLGAANRAVKDQSENVAVAQRRVVEQMQALRDAQAGVTKAQVDGARSVADAQQRVRDAVQNAANAQISAAESIKSAERGVQSARLSTIQTLTQASTKSDAYREALAKLTPEQRKLYDSIAGPKGLKAAFSDWQKSLQGDVVPIFTRGVGGLKNTLPGLTPIVRGAAAGVKELQDRASKSVKSPFWQDFKKEIQKNAKPAVVGLGITFGNIFKGMAGIIRAFLDHMGGINSNMERITGRFATWGKNLKGSPAFEKFLQYVKQMGPKFAHALGEIMGAFTDVSKALSPITGILLTAIGFVGDFISTIAEHAPWLIQLIYAVIVAVKLWTLAQIALNFAMDANPIMLIIIAIGAIVAVVIYCYNKFTWFKNLVDTVWRAISAVIGWVWRTVLKPTFDMFGWVLGKIGAVISWLWKNIVSPVFGWIGERIKWVYQYLIKPNLMLFKWIIGVVGDIISWLWQKIVSPIFGWIGERIKWAWKVLIQPNIQAFRWIVGKLGDGLSWLWEHQVKPIFKWIGDKAAWLWTYGMKPSFNKIMDLASHTGEAFQQLRKVVQDQWRALVGILKTPVRLVIDTVYNRGIVPLWNGVASVTGDKRLSPVDLRGFHTGGIMPGYTPGVDNQVIAVGGGEAIMRPEWTRAVGPDYVNSMNAAARSGGVGAVRRAVSGGMPAFATGGIVDLAKKTWDYATNPSALFDDMKSAANHLVGGLDKNPWVRNFGKLPGTALDSLETKALSWLGLGSGGGVASIGKALKFAMGEAGKPYQWGGAGNPSWDCSGFMSGIQKVIQGRNPRGRLWSTFSFQGDRAPAGWKHNVPAPFMIGVTNRGKGHTAGTLAGVNVESRGGDGVIVGNRARGARSSFFDDVYGFMPSLAHGGAMADVATAQQTARQMLGEFGWGDRQWAPLKALWQHESGWRWNAKNPSTGAYGIPQSLPASKMRSAGADYLTNAATQIKWGMGYIKHRPDYGTPARAWQLWQQRSPHWYDNGGYLQPGMTMVANGTGKPEPVFTSSQWDTLKANVGGGGASASHFDVTVKIGDRDITEIVDVQVSKREAATAASINSGRWV